MMLFLILIKKLHYSSRSEAKSIEKDNLQIKFNQFNIAFGLNCFGGLMSFQMTIEKYLEQEILELLSCPGTSFYGDFLGGEGEGVRDRE